MIATENNRTVALDMLESECSCPYYKTFECTVRDNRTDVSIIWNGSLLSDCDGSGLLLSLPYQSIDGHCNEGGINIIGSIINEDDWYTSQLNITLNFEIIGKKVRCWHSGNDRNNSTSMGQVQEIGSSSITGL